jgi:hypothetical protein
MSILLADFLDNGLWTADEIDYFFHTSCFSRQIGLERRVSLRIGTSAQVMASWAGSEARSHLDVVDYGCVAFKYGSSVLCFYAAGQFSGTSEGHRSVWSSCNFCFLCTVYFDHAIGAKMLSPEGTYEAAESVSLRAGAARAVPARCAPGSARWPPGAARHSPGGPGSAA